MISAGVGLIVRTRGKCCHSLITQWFVSPNETKNDKVARS